MNRRPHRQASIGLSRFCGDSCSEWGSKCNNATPSITPETKLNVNCTLRCVKVTNDGKVPPMTDAKTIKTQYATKISHTNGTFAETQMKTSYSKRFVPKSPVVASPLHAQRLSWFFQEFPIDLFDVLPTRPISAHHLHSRRKAALFEPTIQSRFGNRPIFGFINADNPGVIGWSN